MVIKINHAFVSPKSDSADTTIVRPSNWNAALVWSGLTANALLYSTDATTLAQDATNLSYTTASGPRLQVGSGSTTSAGWISGYVGASGYAGLWVTSQTPTTSNAILQANLGETYLQGSTIKFRDLTGSGIIWAQIFTGSAGKGLYLSPGAATTDVQALSATQTWNNAGVTFTMFKGVATVTAAAAGSLLADLQTAGGGSMFSVRASDGLITTGGTAGVSSFGPSAVTSITVKNGIITAIS